MDQRGLENANIPIGGDFWRGLGRNGALIVGYALVVIHVAIITIKALQARSLDFRTVELWDAAALWSTIVAPLLAMCLLFIGELSRRGEWNRNQRDQGHSLKEIGNTVHLRMVPLAWHVLWGNVALAVAVMLLWLAWSEPWSSQSTTSAVNGVIAAGVGGAILGSRVKKSSWFRTGRARQVALLEVSEILPETAENPLRTKFWRHVGYMWRLDLWCVGVGMVVLWLAGWALVTRDVYSGSTESATVAGAIGIAVGVVMVLGGLWATTQFWRSGEDLAKGESVG